MPGATLVVRVAVGNDGDGPWRAAVGNGCGDENAASNMPDVPGLILADASTLIAKDGDGRVY